MSEIAKCRCGAEPTVTRGISARSYVECNSLDCTGPFCTTGATAAEAIAAWNALMRPRPVATSTPASSTRATKCRCGAEPTVARGISARSYVECSNLDCCTMGPFGATAAEAIASWNALMLPRPVARWRPASRTIVECPVCHVLLGVAAGHGVHATCPGCLCVLATGYGGAGTETRLCAATFSRKYGTERI